MVSAWVLTSIIPLIASNAYALKKIGDLQGALNTKDILLNSDRTGFSRVVQNGVMVITPETPLVSRIRIQSRRDTELKVTIE